MAFRLLISIVFFVSSSAFASDFNCSSILEDRDPITALDREWARELIAWVTNTHPILERAIMREDNRSFPLDLIHFSSGFALPPANEKSVAARVYLASTTFESNFLFASWGWRTLAGDAEAATDMGAASREARFKVTERIAGRVRQLLSDLGESGGSTAYRFNDRLFEEGWVKQHLKIHWEKSFTAEEFARIKQLKHAIEDVDVMKAFIRELHSNLPRIIRAHRALVGRLEKVTSASEVRAAYRAWQSSSEFAAISFFAEQLPPEAVPGARSALKVVAAPNSARSEPVRPPPAPVEVTPAPPALNLTPVRAPAFDEATIAEFIDQSKIDLPSRLEQIPFLKIWSSLNRLGQVFTGGLGQLAKWRTVEPDWPAWEHSLSQNEAWSARLNEVIRDLHARRAKELDQLILAEASFEKLHAWLMSLHEYFRSFQNIASDAEKLSDRDKRALRAVIDQIQALTIVSDRTRFNISNRQHLIFDLNVTTNHLTYMLGDLEQQRLLSEQAPDVGELRKALGQLGSPLVEEADAD